MEKILVINKDEIFDIVVNCYQTDNKFIKKYHELAGSSLSACIDRTASDFILNDVTIYKLLTDKSEFVGYFGQQNDWLTGFFIIPQMRTVDNKLAFWNLITEHFKNGFTVGMLLKNKPARNFLKKNGCISIRFEESKDGMGEIMQYKKVEV